MIVWVRSLIRRRKPVPAALGSRPGFLWDVHGKRWVPVERALSCRHDAYSEFGPVYRVAGLQP